jgi:hypothetical protein
MGAEIVFYFQEPFSGWMPTSIFQSFFNHQKNIHKDKITADTISTKYNSESGHTTGPHNLIIKNLDTNKYKAISYCDNPSQLLNDVGGWDNKNCLGIYACPDSGIHKKIIPASYCEYNREISKYIQNMKTDVLSKKPGLCFRGYLYNERHTLSQYLNHQNVIQIHSNRLTYAEYANELNYYQIGLSFNGVAEICNRDIEILAAGSVLLRPRLYTSNFYNPLIEDYHYISFPILNDPKDQIDAIISTYESLRKDKDKINFVANNGHNWYNTNGSESGNVLVLSKIVKLEELYE